MAIRYYPADGQKIYGTVNNLKEGTSNNVTLDYMYVGESGEYDKVLFCLESESDNNKDSYFTFEMDSDDVELLIQQLKKKIEQSRREA